MRRGAASRVGWDQGPRPRGRAARLSVRSAGAYDARPGGAEGSCKMSREVLLASAWEWYGVASAGASGRERPWERWASFAKQLQCQAAVCPLTLFSICSYPLAWFSSSANRAPKPASKAGTRAIGATTTTPWSTTRSSVALPGDDPRESEVAGGRSKQPRRPCRG